MRCVELFAGAGGLSYGFQKAGFEIVGAFDNWEDALNVYEANLGHPTFCVDLSDPDPAAEQVRALRPDIIVGGPPCQDFSSAGSRTEGKNAELTIAFVKIAERVRPRWIVIENVQQMLKSQAWGKARQMLARAGYGISVSKVDAAFYGVPQHRKRVVVICRLGEADHFMETAIEQAAAEKPMSMRELFREAIPHFVYSHPRFAGKRCVFSATEPSPTIRSTSRRPIPKRYYEDDASILAAGFFFVRPFHGGRGVRSLDEACPAIIRTSRERPRPGYLTAPHPRDPVHPSQAKTLTQAQTSRVQGFPEWWDWSCARTVRNVDQMIANAVPTPLAQAIAGLVLEREDGGIPPIPDDFLVWLQKAMRFGKRAVQNIQNNLRQAWRHLAGRIFADHRHELLKLQTSAEFAAMNSRHRSNVREALKLHQEWRYNCGKARPQEHQLPERGGLRAFFREVGRRILASLEPTKSSGRAKPKKTRRNARIDTPAKVAPTAPPSSSKPRETASVDSLFAQNGSDARLAIISALDGAPLALQSPREFPEPQGEVRPPAESGKEVYRHAAKADKFAPAIAVGDGSSTDLKFEINREYGSKRDNEVFEYRVIRTADG